MGHSEGYQKVPGPDRGRQPGRGPQGAYLLWEEDRTGGLGMGLAAQGLLSTQSRRTEPHPPSFGVCRPEAFSQAPEGQGVGVGDRQ